jgi:4-hydroxy-tetrahydrodipicolinate synthase
MLAINGAFPVLPTIFDSAGAVDEAAVLRVAEWAIGCGADGLVFPGLASEYDQLSLGERLRLIEVLGAFVRGRAVFIAGCGGHSDEESAALLQVAAEAGASAAMIVTPNRLRDDLDQVASFYKELAANSDIPIMLQNAPSPMGLGLDPADVMRIVAAAPGIRYVKEENAPCGQRITALRGAADGRLDGIFGGAGGRYITDELARGADGTMPAAEIADLHVRLIAAHRRGSRPEVRALFERTLPLLNMQAVFRWRLTKEVLRRRGVIDSTYVRAPGPELDRHDLGELDEIMAGLEDLMGNAGSNDLATADRHSRDRSS